MAQVLDKIEYDGIQYEFVDSTARANIISVSKSMDGFESKVSAETTRAVAAETAIRADMASSSEIDALSDKVDAFETEVDKIKDMTGATSTADGDGGFVPKPLKANKDMYLKGDGTWSNPPGRDIENASSTSAGLMSSTDKQKLDSLGGDQDLQPFEVTISGNTITQKYKIGSSVVKTITTTFNSNGTISQTVVAGSAGKTFKIEFSGNSIVRSEV